MAVTLGHPFGGTPFRPGRATMAGSAAAREDYVQAKKSGVATYGYTTQGNTGCQQAHGQPACSGKRCLAPYLLSTLTLILSLCMQSSEKPDKPFIFHHRNHTFLVLGGNLNETKGGQAVVNIYEAQKPGLTELPM